MRKYVIIFSLICLAFISACETATNVDHDHDNEKEKAPIIQTEGKPEMDKATLEEDALFRFEGEVDGAKFFAYFFAENQAEKSLEETSFFGQEGDPVVSGEYDFYLAEKNSDVAYKQTQLDSLDMKFNIDHRLKNTIEVEGYDVFMVFANEVPKFIYPYMFMLQNGELVKIDTEDLKAPSTTEFKVFDDNKLQTAYLVNNRSGQNGGWHFPTLEFDAEQNQLTLIKEEIYNDITYPPNGFDYGHDRYATWMDEEASIIPYKESEEMEEWEITKEILNEAAAGRIADTPVKLNDNIKKMRKENKRIQFENWYEGGKVLYYPGYNVGYAPKHLESSDGKVTMIIIPGERIHMTVSEIKDTLGKPRRDMYDEMSESNLLIYIEGKNHLHFVYDESDGNVKSAVLREADKGEM